MMKIKSKEDVIAVVALMMLTAAFVISPWFNPLLNGARFVAIGGFFVLLYDLFAPLSEIY